MASSTASVLALVGVGLLQASTAQGQTLLWSARYDSGGDDGLGAGTAFRVEGSGAVTLAGRSGSAFLLVRYETDGTLDKSRIQATAFAFSPVSVWVDGEGRSLWAGSTPAPTGGSEARLMRFSFVGDGETLLSMVPAYFQSFSGTMIQGAGDGGLLFGYDYSGQFASYGHWVTKFQGTGPAWRVGGGWPLGGNRCDGQLIAPDPSGGALLSVWTLRPSFQRVDASGAVAWSKSCADGGWPWLGNPYLGVVDVGGNAHVAGRSPQGDFLTAQFDPAGNIVWQRTVDGTGHGDDIPTGLAADIGGSLYVTGSSIGAGGTADYLTVKYDAAGTLLWARIYEGAAVDAPAGVAVDAAGNAWVTGVSGADLFTIKYDPSGNPVFSHRFASAGPPTVSGVVLDSWGNATVAFSAAGDIFVLRYGEAPTKVGPLSFQTVDPCRAFDSRDAALGGPSPLAGPSDYTIALAGVCGVPAMAKAVSLNVTAVSSTQPGNLVLFPAGQTAPLTSVINYSAGQTRANNATVGLGANASLGLRVNQSSGAVHALVDVVGYWQ